uniref:Uncharacterized protein n=1 Tax=viral metagenome TaxID=1070528 RepID=A0A6C0CGE9_9ZZZZ
MNFIHFNGEAILSNLLFEMVDKTGRSKFSTSHIKCKRN